MNCRVCNTTIPDSLFSAQILQNSYTISYFHCPKCGSLQTEQPYWLDKAYEESINISDTGILLRNKKLSNVTSLIVLLFFSAKKKFLDLAGGYGLFTRLMRDKGFDYYWSDKYSQNLVARGFEYCEGDDIELITLFEAAEHFEAPLQEFKKALTISTNLLFTTELLHKTIPDIKTWWYYGLEHGQHITFYSKKTLKYIARECCVNYYTDNRNIHLMTTKKLNPIILQSVMLLGRVLSLDIFSLFLRSRTLSDMHMLKK